MVMAGNAGCRDRTPPWGGRGGGVAPRSPAGNLAERAHRWSRWASSSRGLPFSRSSMSPPASRFAPANPAGSLSQDHNDAGWVRVALPCRAVPPGAPRLPARTEQALSTGTVWASAMGQLPWASPPGTLRPTMWGMTAKRRLGVGPGGDRRGHEPLSRTSIPRKTGQTMLFQPARHPRSQAISGGG